ncbi:MAG TPA: MYXO-CTERM sorting domain-containing protein [Polyangiaceae bacterium]|nr:MYXO-CTERM sorting domain-containing protein [Polyangiaceae bacterium]
MSRRGALVGLALGLAAAPRPSAASPAYSTLLAQRVGAATEPACGVCHGADPAVDPLTMTPFGQALRDRGFTDSSNLVAAFDQMAAEKVDSDGDKALDTDELGWGGDPNGYDGVRGEPTPEVRQGFCGVGPGPGARAPAGVALAALFGLAAIGRRRPKKG